MRLKQRDLEYVLKGINACVGTNFVLTRYDGLYHVIDRGCVTVEGVVTGTLRECYDYCVALRHGITIAQGR